MRPFWLMSFVAAAWMLIGGVARAAEPVFGRWMGVLVNERLDREQLVKLDFVTVRRVASEFQLMAMMSVYFGDFESGEYVTYHFDSVRYDVVTGTLVFDQMDQDVTFVVRRFNGGEMEADVRSATIGDIGHVSLRRSESAVATRELLRPLWGEYRGLCGGISTRLQVQTYRSVEDTSRLGNPFGAYEVQAQYAEDRPEGCMGHGSSCVKWLFPAGSYNFHQGDLKLVGTTRTLSCRVMDDTIRCGDCDLRRHTPALAKSGEFTYPSKTADWTGVAPAESSASSLQGTYTGWVHHEYLDVYQPARISLVTYQDGGRGTLRVSAVGALGFGSMESSETIAYRFKETSIDVLTSQVVLENIEADVDAVVKVESMRNGELRGAWNSILFGRVGTFVLAKNGVKASPSWRVMESVSASYKGPRWAMSLMVVRESAPLATQNPFYPLNLRGSVRLIDITGNFDIQGGTYDFYTGRFALRFDERTPWVGTRVSRDRIALKLSASGPSSPLGSNAFEIFQLTSRSSR